jgi:ADP-ribose pyrophosphatase YjhB (NUDIX family)
MKSSIMGVLLAIRRRIRRIHQQTQGRLMNSTRYFIILVAASLSMLLFSIIPAIFHHQSKSSSITPSSSHITTSDHSCIVSYGKYDGKIYELPSYKSKKGDDAATDDYSPTSTAKKKKSTSSSSSLRSFETVVVASAAAITASSSSSSSSSTAFETINNTCLVESPWMRISRHSVRLPAPTTVLDNTVGENTDAIATRKIINDWLYIDYHDRINVLVEAPPLSSDQEDDDNDDIDKVEEMGKTHPKSLGNSNSKTTTTTTTKDTTTTTIQEKEFIILQQTKYALNGQRSLAIVGGLISNNEEPILAAKREVQEELSIVCTTWTSLGASSPSSSANGSSNGKQHETKNNRDNNNNYNSKVGRFRTDVNRGMGWIYPYLATDCIYLNSNKKEDGISSQHHSNNDDDNGNDDDEVGGHDVEKQVVQRITITDIRTAVMAGRFVEVQWSNTVALAMLHYFTMLAV